MMSVFVVPVDVSDENEKQEAEVTNQEIVLGRSFLVFSCDDTRISRNQGILRHRIDTSDYVTIKSTHLNPIYYKVDGGTNIEILLKEKEVFLKHGDQFGFLPDKCWFKISIKKTDNVEATSLMLRVRPVAELNDSQNLPEIIPQVSNVQQMSETISQEVSSENNLIILPTSDFNFFDAPQTPNLNEREVELTQPSVKREAEETSNGSPKRQRTENENPTSSTSNNDPQVPCQSSESTTSNQPAAPCSSSTTVKKEEPDSTDNLRDSCQYGVGCYRHTVEHRREFAHPGDSDYRRPNFPSAPSGTPMCSYGARCYRRHPYHFVEYSHPPSTGPASCSNGNNDPSSANMPAWLPRPLRQPKTEENSDSPDFDSSNNGDFSGGDDDEFEVNLIPEESSDEIDSDLEESDDNSAILDDGDANED